MFHALLLIRRHATPVGRRRRFIDRGGWKQLPFTSSLVRWCRPDGTDPGLTEYPGPEVAVISAPKTYVTAMILGASAPLVVGFILAQRAGRKQVVRQARRAMEKMVAQFDRAAEERERWRNDLVFGELLEWALESPLFNPRPK